MIEKAKTPRHKPCSGIQFSYIEKMIGEKIPRSVLCDDIETIDISNPHIELPRPKGTWIPTFLELM